jgi:glycine/D-amino acid oxidase-like deaminating enzyme
MQNSSAPAGITRRHALTATGGALAAAALAQTAPAVAAEAQEADAIVVGHGLAGLVATAELAAAGRKVLLLDQEPEASLGGQAFWSFGGLFFVDSVEQRLMGIKDTRELAWQDWLGTAGFDRGVGDPTGQDYWGYKWAEAYVDFAAGEKRSWLAGLARGPPSSNRSRRRSGRRGPPAGSSSGSGTASTAS